MSKLKNLLTEDDLRSMRFWGSTYAKFGNEGLLESAAEYIMTADALERPALYTEWGEGTRNAAENAEHDDQCRRDLHKRILLVSNR